MVYVFSSISKFTVVTIPQKRLRNTKLACRRHIVLESACIAVIQYLFVRLLANVTGCMTEILTLVVSLLVNATFFFMSIIYYQIIGKSGVRYIFHIIRTTRSRNAGLNFSLKTYKTFVDLAVGSYYILMVSSMYVFVSRALPPELTNETYETVLLFLFLISNFYHLAWTFSTMLIVAIITIILNRLTIILPRVKNMKYLRFTWGNIFEAYMLMPFSYGLLGLTGIFVTFGLMIVGILSAHINVTACVFHGYIYIACGSLTALLAVCETLVSATKNVSTWLSLPDYITHI